MVESMYLELETVTPLFMYGADQNHPEIRAASIKGVMRWWWRAVAGNIYTIDDMRYKESEIFGGAVKREEKAEKIKSPTLLNIGDVDFKKTNVCAKPKNHTSMIKLIICCFRLFVAEKTKTSRSS